MVWSEKTLVTCPLDYSDVTAPSRSFDSASSAVPLAPETHSCSIACRMGANACGIDEDAMSATLARFIVSEREKDKCLTRSACSPGRLPGEGEDGEEEMHPRQVGHLSP